MKDADAVSRRPVTRRGFLKSSTLAAATHLAVSRQAHAAGSDTIRVGMIGCGGRCTGAAVNALEADPGTRLVAMSDLFEDRVRTSLASIRTSKPDQVDVDDDACFVGLDGYREVIERSDVVLIACAAKFHPLYLLAGIQAGKHVFVEKPHGIDPAGIQQVREASALAKRTNVGILSGLHSRFDARIGETIHRVLDGQIGKILTIEENFIRGPYGNTSRPEGWPELEVQYGNQYRFSWLCGDDVSQSLVHNLDRATWALGETPPVSCHGLGGRSSSQRLLGDVFDHHAVKYRYANGIRLYAFCRTTIGCHNESSSVIVGSEGTAYPLRGRITGRRAWTFEGEAESPYVAEHRAFLKSIRDGKPLQCGDYMARSTLVAIMGQLSCYSGKQVRWEDLQESDYVLGPKPEDCTWDMEPPTRPDADGVYPDCATPGVTRNV